MMLRNKMRSGSALALAGACALAWATPATAATVEFGGPPVGIGDCTPGCTPRIQTVYSGAAFGSEAVSISAISFYLANFGAANTQDYTITLSTSANAVGSLVSTYADNIGADAAVFYANVPNVPSTAGWFTFVGSPFTYDPTAGDLLVDILTTGDHGIFSSYNGSGPNAQRVYGFPGQVVTGSVDAPGYHFVTRFTVGEAGVIPEPVTWAMMIVGFGLVGTAARKRRRSAGQIMAASIA